MSDVEMCGICDHPTDEPVSDEDFGYLCPTCDYRLRLLTAFIVMGGVSNQVPERKERRHP